MSGRSNSSHRPTPSAEPPMLLRMLHPTSGQEGFHGGVNPIFSPTQVPVDPRFATMINMQTQQAIAASGIPSSSPYSGYGHHQPSSYAYGGQQPYAYFPRQ